MLVQCAFSGAGETTIGRNDDQDLTIADASVSSNHATIDVVDVPAAGGKCITLKVCSPRVKGEGDRFDLPVAVSIVVVVVVVAIESLLFSCAVASRHAVAAEPMPYESTFPVMDSGMLDLLALATQHGTSRTFAVQMGPTLSTR